jgi:hypothetical protein
VYLRLNLNRAFSELFYASETAYLNYFLRFQMTIFRFFIKSLLSICMAMILVACGSNSSSDSASSNSTKPAGVEGIVFTDQGPVPNVLVVVKDYDGQLLGQATTDASGAYFIPTVSTGPFIAQAKDPKSNAVLYGISQNSIMNITHVADFMIKRWYEALSLNATQVFDSLNVNTPAPEEAAMSTVIDQFFYPVAKAFNVDSLDLFRDDISVIFASALRATTITGNTISINMTEPFVRASFMVQARADEQGDVIFSGQSVFDTAMTAPLKSINNQSQFGEVKSSFVAYWNDIQSVIARLSKAISPIASAHAAPVNSNIGGIVPNVKGAHINEHWMADNWDFIKDKRLAQIVIPGTHDSGTYQMGWGEGINVAKTQNVSIGEQLKDGIRYLDLRTREATHKGCADDSVWWIVHGDYWSYRLQDALDEIANFVKKPANSKEVIILDLQEIRTEYDDDRAVDVLFGLIQKKLGPYIVPIDQANKWQEKSLADFVSQGRQIIVLAKSERLKRINAPGFKPGCGAKFDSKYFTPREDNLGSRYIEAETASALQDRLITPQLLRGSALGDNLFNDYKTRQGKGSLNVLQIVPRPSNSWFINAWVTAFPGYPYDLLTYASLQINAPLHLKLSDSDVNTMVVRSLLPPFDTKLSSYCASGWLGKRLLMGVQGNPADWNMPNIIMVDNYNPTNKNVQFDWVLPKYTNGGWVKDWQGGYVDFIIRLNRLKRDDALNGVTNFSDSQCLP